MLDKVKNLIKEYGLDVSTVFESQSHLNNNLSVGIEEGSNEGYYVVVKLCYTEINIRVHDKDEALKTLGVMLILL